MARIPPNYNKYPWYMRLLFRSQRKKYGAPLEPVQLWGRTPKVFFGFLWMQNALNRKKSPIDPILRALITIKVSQINDCSFCIDMNSFLLLQRGGSEDKIEDLSQIQTSSRYTDSEKAALEYAEAITLSNSKVTDELFEKLKSHFNDDAIVELTALIAIQNLSSKFNAALDAAPSGFCQRRPQKRT